MYLGIQIYATVAYLLQCKLGRCNCKPSGKLVEENVEGVEYGIPVFTMRDVKLINDIRQHWPWKVYHYEGQGQINNVE